MAKFSTGLRTKMLQDTALKAALALGQLKIYSGPAPATADAATTGTLLATLTVSGGSTGLSFGTAADGVISKAAGEVWMTSAIAASGNAGYFRFVAAGDTGVLSTTQMRIQGTVGVAGADLVATDVAMVAGQPWTLNYFSVALPTE